MQFVQKSTLLYEMNNCYNSARRTNTLIDYKKKNFAWTTCQYFIPDNILSKLHDNLEILCSFNLGAVA
jgi:hypothetical protein